MVLSEDRGDHFSVIASMGASESSGSCDQLLNRS